MLSLFLLGSMNMLSASSVFQSEDVVFKQGCSYPEHRKRKLSTLVYKVIIHQQNDDIEDLKMQLRTSIDSLKSLKSRLYNKKDDDSHLMYLKRSSLKFLKDQPHIERDNQQSSAQIEALRNQIIHNSADLTEDQEVLEYDYDILEDEPDCVVVQSPQKACDDVQDESSCSRGGHSHLVFKNSVFHIAARNNARYIKRLQQDVMALQEASIELIGNWIKNECHSYAADSVFKMYKLETCKAEFNLVDLKLKKNHQSKQINALQQQLYRMKIAK